MPIIDTQILSYAYKGLQYRAKDMKISSTVANEFLEVYDPTSNNSNKYYIFYMPNHGIFKSHRAALGQKPLMDRINLDFGPEYPTIIEFGSRSVADLINDRNTLAFNAITEHLERPRRRKLRNRFRFICDQISECVPLSEEAARTGAELLHKFVKRHNLKKVFRNSVNDLMVLSVTYHSHEAIRTEDHELAQFAMEEFGAKITELSDGTLEVDFKVSEPKDEWNVRESKGYINRGWAIADEKKRSS
jgi:hypothetical protein